MKTTLKTKVMRIIGPFLFLNGIGTQSFAGKLADAIENLHAIEAKMADTKLKESQSYLEALNLVQQIIEKTDPKDFDELDKEAQKTLAPECSQFCLIRSYESKGKFQTDSQLHLLPPLRSSEFVNYNSYLEESKINLLPPPPDPYACFPVRLETRRKLIIWSSEPTSWEPMRYSCYSEGPSVMAGGLTCLAALNCTLCLLPAWIPCGGRMALIFLNSACGGITGFTCCCAGNSIAKNVLLLTKKAVKKCIRECAYRDFPRYAYRSEECQVCLENYLPKQEISTLNCLHEFHSRCISSCLENDSRCPLCRSEIEIHSTRFLQPLQD